MVSTPALLLTLAFIALFSRVNGDSSGAVHSDSPDANNITPHSFNRQTMFSKSQLTSEEQEGGQPLSPMESLLSILARTSADNAQPISQEEYASYDGESETPYSLVHAWAKRSGMMTSPDRVLKPNSKERFFRLLQQRPQLGNGGLGNGISNNPAWTSNDLKRERSSGATLSVESSLDLIRQKFMQELRRRQNMEKQKQIDSNGDLFSSIGKRSGYQSPMVKH